MCVLIQLKRLSRRPPACLAREEWLNRRNSPPDDCREFLNLNLAEKDRNQLLLGPFIDLKR